ncbi:MAG: AAA family ATPase, partial [Bacteroidota bacterium]
MAYQITVPFYAFRLHFSPGVHFMSPLRDKATLRSSVQLHDLAKEYELAIQNKVLNKGAAFRLLNEWCEQDFIKDVIHVPFPASSDGVTYPDFELEFEIYYQEMENGFWGVVPILGVEAHAVNFEYLLKNLISTVKIEFARNNYLTSVQSIISRIWFKSAELLHAEMNLLVADPGEDLSQKELENKTKILRKVARKLEVKRQEVFGREEELNRVEQALKSSFTKNILIVGPTGVGKTALVWETVRQMSDRKINGTIWETTASNMIKELSGDTGWEYNVSELCRELKGLDGQFLFIRNLMDLFEVGKYVGNSVSIADYLLPFISKGEINIISECTDEELARIELASPAYTANFQVIRLEEPQKDLEGIILKKVNQLASTTQMEVDEEAIKEVIRLIRRFTPYAGMPGRPIRFLESIILNKTENGKSEAAKIGRTEVIEYFCEDTGMPMFMVDPSIPLFTDKIKERFNSSVFGQESAVDSLVDILATVKAALTKSGKPIASLLFVGPTGVGKTELAKVLAEFMFGRRNRMLRFDMSEYSNPYSVMRLIGQDNTSEGQLTAAVRRDPFSVILFDEIEKADSTFFDLLLQVLSEGRLTDNRGNLANFCSTIIIMTSNIGASSHSTNPIGWNKGITDASVKTHFVGAVRKHFRPELFNRIDKIIPFVPLDKDTVRFVVDREIKLFKELEGVKFRKLDLEIEEEVYDFLAEKG